MIVPQNNSPLIFFIINSNLSSYQRLERNFINSADKVVIGPNQEKIGYRIEWNPDSNEEYDISFSDMLYQEFRKSLRGITNRIDSLQYDTEKIKNFIHECLVILSHIAADIKKEPTLNKDGLYQYIIQLNVLFKSHYNWYLDDEMTQMMISTSQILKEKKHGGNQNNRIVSFKSLVEPHKIDLLFDTIKNLLIYDDGNTREKFKQAFSTVALDDPLKIKWTGRSLVSLDRFINLLSEIGVIEKVTEPPVKAKMIGHIFVKNDGAEFKNIINSIDNKKSDKLDMIESIIYPQIRLLFNKNRTEDDVL